MKKYSRLQNENLKLVYDKRSDQWMNASSRYAYRKVKWKHLPKYARHAITIINIAGPGAWVMNHGEMRVGEFDTLHYVVMDPIRVWEHDCEQWHLSGSVF